MAQTGQMQRTLAWWIGDLLVAAEDRFDAGRFDPDRYRTAARLTKKSYLTLKQ
ncbi:MAG: hypothetical protein V7644_2105, partial [Actinomycetota bacterium]